MPKTTFGERVQIAAKRKKLENNADFARFMKVRPQTSHNWWTGTTSNPSVADVYKLADALAVSPRWLALGEGPMDIDTTMKPDEAELLKSYRKLHPDEKALLHSMMGRFKGQADEDATGSA